MTQLSIIVPVYNKVRFLDECIDSILSQSFPDFELILVNDGSTDGSDLICQKHANLDSRIIIINQQNAGVSAARNAGLKIAKGRFTGFIDSDDNIHKDMYQLLVRNIEMHGADISVCRLQSISAGKTECPQEKQGAFTLNHQQGLEASLKGMLDRSANNKIYRTDLARAETFEGSIYEDILYTNKMFIRAQKTVAEDVVKYNYMIRNNSASMQSFNDNYLQTVQTSARIVDLVAKKSPECLGAAYSFDIATNLALLNLILLAGIPPHTSIHARVVSNLRSYSDLIRTSEVLTRKQKSALKLHQLSPALYKFLLLVYCKITGANALKRTAI